MASGADPILALRCPKCDHDEARLSVISATVLSVKCEHCSHFWSTAISVLPESIRKCIPSVLERS